MLKKVLLILVAGLVIGCSSGSPLAPLFESLTSQGISVKPYVLSPEEKAIVDKINKVVKTKKDPTRESMVLQGIRVEVQVFPSNTEAREAYEKLEKRQEEAKAEFAKIKKMVMEGPNPEETLKKLRVFEREEYLRQGRYVIEIPYYRVPIVDGKMSTKLAAVEIDQDALNQLKEAFGKFKSD